VPGRQIAPDHVYWATVRSAERIIRALTRLLTGIVANVSMRKRLVETLPRPAQARATDLQRLPIGAGHFRALLPLYPSAARRLDVRGCDLVSNCAGLCHASRSDGAQLCFRLSRLRYTWSENWAPLALQPTRNCRTLLALHLDREWPPRLMAARRLTRVVVSVETGGARIVNNCGRPSALAQPLIPGQLRVQRCRPRHEVSTTVSASALARRDGQSVSAWRHGANREVARW
jgi:hypothetical protein